MIEVLIMISRLTWSEGIEEEKFPLEAKEGRGDSMVEESRGFVGAAVRGIREEEYGEEAGDEDEYEERGIWFPNGALDHHPHYVLLEMSFWVWFVIGSDLRENLDREPLIEWMKASERKREKDRFVWV